MDTKTKFLSVCMFCLGLHCGIVFQCSNTSSPKANDTNAESRLHVFLIFPLFSSISFSSQRPQNPIFRFVLRPLGVGWSGAPHPPVPSFFPTLFSLRLRSLSHYAL